VSRHVVGFDPEHETEDVEAPYQRLLSEASEEWLKFTCKESMWLFSDGDFRNSSGAEAERRS